MKLTHFLTGMRAARWFRVVMVLIILTAISAQSAFSQIINAPEALPTWTKIPVDAPSYLLNMRDRSMAYNPLTDIPCMAYGGDALYYSCWNPTTSSWDTALVDASLSVGQYTAMVFDHYNRPFITYYDAHNGRLKLAYLNGGIWNIQVVPDATVYAPTSLTGVTEPAVETPATASAETPAAPAPGEDPAAATATATPTEAEEPSTLAQLEGILKANAGEEASAAPDFLIESAIGYGKFSSIAVDPGNGFHISYYDELNRTLDYQYWNGLTFDGVVVHHYNDQGRTGLWTSIQVGSNYGVHIAFMSEKYDDLMYAYRAPNQWPDKKWDIDTAHGDTASVRVNTGSFASLALDSNNRPHISYYDFTNKNLRHAWKTSEGAWNQENVATTGDTGWYTSIAIDSDNRVHISFYEVTDGELKYARKAGGDWTIRTVDSSGPGNTGMFTSIDLDVDEDPGIFYTHTGVGAAKYIHATRSDGSRWSEPSYVNYYFRDVGAGNSLALNTAGSPFISYLDATIGQLKYARAFGPFWYKDFVPNGERNIGWFSSIALSGEFSPRIAYYEQTKGNLWYATWSGGGWTHTKLDQHGDVGRFVSQEIDSAAIPHISYYDATDGDLLYATWSVLSSSWVTTTVDTLDDTGRFTSITVDPANLPWVSYYDHTGGSLNMACKTSTTQTWDITPVDNVGRVGTLDVGISSSIALDSAGRPHISYYDIINGDLKYAYWDGVCGGAGSWNVSVLDSVGDVGLYSSLAIDPVTDTRHLCYYDYTNGNLKYAQKVGAAAWEFQIVDGDVADGDGIDEGDVGYYCSIDLNGLGQPAISYYDNSHADLKLAMSYPMPSLALLANNVFLPVVRR